MPNFPKGPENYIIKTDEDIKKFLDAVAKRTISILRDEVKINAVEGNLSSLKESHINLIGFTSIISVEDYNKITVIFNYDYSLIEEIFIRCTKNIKIPKDETQLYIDETASDLINVIIGNILSQFGRLDYAFNISTPSYLVEMNMLLNSMV